jgi:hypothetical protein
VNRTTLAVPIRVAEFQGLIGRPFDLPAQSASAVGLPALRATFRDNPISPGRSKPRLEVDKGKILPTMRTDIVLDHAASGRRIVIDTKFTSIVTVGWHREETLRSGYVYQIYAYLRSQVGRGDAFADSASGLLLHPSVGPEVDQTVVIQGHSVRFATVDLTASASSIRSRLLRLCDPIGYLQ